MQDRNTILASSVNSIQNVTVFDRMIQARLAEVDLSAMCMYLIDICPVEALPILAKQFDMLGFNGWVLCDTEEQRRTLIKRAIELKKYRGTPWAVKEALKSVGYYDVQIQEGVSGALYNNVYTYNGAITHGGGNWAVFRLNLLDLGEQKGFSTAELALITEVINKYKAARCSLLDIVLTVSTIDYFDETDESFILNTALGFEDEFNVNHTYNGSGLHDGSWLYSGEVEEFEVYINGEAVDEYFEADDSNFIINILYSSGYVIITTESGNNITTEDGFDLIIE